MVEEGPLSMTPFSILPVARSVTWHQPAEQVHDELEEVDD
jgi:hypothetical protein